MSVVKSIRMNLYKDKWSYWASPVRESKIEPFVGRFKVQDILVAPVIGTNQKFYGQIGFGKSGDRAFNNDEYFAFIIQNGVMYNEFYEPLKDKLIMKVRAKDDGKKIWLRFMPLESDCKVNAEVKIAPMKNKSWKEKYNQEVV